MDTDSSQPSGPAQPSPELLIKGLDHMISAINLRLGLGTGATVLLLHDILGGHLRPAPLILMSLTATGFAVAALQCIGGLQQISLCKALVEIAAQTKEEQQRKDATNVLKSAQRQFDRQDNIFTAAVLFAIIAIGSFVLVSLKKTDSQQPQTQQQQQQRP